MSAAYVVKRSGAPHYYEILEYDPNDESGWIESIEQVTGEYEILAWMPLPEPYRVGAEIAHTEKPRTNADRIRSMTDEELAGLLKEVKEDYQWANPDYPDCEDCGEWLKWLQSEAE